MQQDEYFQSGEARLRYRDEGAGPPLVLIHGWTLDLEVWNPQAAALGGSHRIVRYDRRGFGLSEGAPGIAADLEDLARLLDHLDLGAPTLVGLSQGARVALAYALRQPDRVAGLVLDGPPDEVGDPAAAGDEDFSIAEYRALVRDRGVDAFRDSWRAHPLMRLYGSNPSAAELIGRMLARYPARDLQGPAAVRAAAGRTVRTRALREAGARRQRRIRHADPPPGGRGACAGAAARGARRAARRRAPA